MFKATVFVLALSAVAVQAQAQQQVDKTKPQLSGPMSGSKWSPAPAEHSVSWYLGNLDETYRTLEQCRIIDVNIARFNDCQNAYFARNDDEYLQTRRALEATDRVLSKELSDPRFWALNAGMREGVLIQCEHPRDAHVNPMPDECAAAQKSKETAQ